jgi:hypothetical protein
MHAGKTTLANNLLLYQYKRMAFADPVKEIGADMLNVFLAYMNDGRYYDSDTINTIKGHPAVRGLLQLVGTELGREWYGPQTIWIDLFKNRLAEEQAFANEYGYTLTVVNDDCRFVNEASALRELGFIIVKLHRPEDERVQSIINALKKEHKDATPQEISAYLDKILSHPSETEVDSIKEDIVLRSTTMRSLERIAKILASENALEQLADVDNSDLIRYNPNDYVAHDLPMGMRAAYAHS